MAPRKKKETVEIWYGVLGEGSVFSVTIANDATVANLCAAIFKQERFEDRFSFPASAIKLFMPEDSETVNEQLQGVSKRNALLANADVPETGFKEMDPMWKLNSPNCFGPTFPVKDEEIHVLVKVPGEGPDSKRRRIDEVLWQNASGKFSSLAISNVDRFLAIPNRYVEGSGIETPEPNGPLVLYRRGAVQDQWDEIQRCVIDSHAQLYIVGAPGAGKSCATYAYACCRVDRTQWTVVWIHTPRIEKGFCLVMFDENQKATARVTNPTAVQEILGKLEARRTDKKLLVFLDSFVETNKPTKKVEEALSSWQSHSVDKRRFVCVTSQGTLGKWNHSSRGRIILRVTGSDIIRQRMAYNFPSWKLDEYVEAVKNPQFVKTVKPFLRMQHDGTDAPACTPAVELVCTKYFYVGASARHMLGYRTKEAINTLNESLERVPDLETLQRGTMGAASPTAINCLIARYRTTSNDGPTSHLVSLYTARNIANKVGAHGVQRFASLFGFNPSLDGWLLENWFFLALESSGVWYYEGDVESREMNEKACMWHSNTLLYFDPKSSACRLQVGWNAPVDWNQAGYDAVYWQVNSATKTEPAHCTLMFVQITLGKKKQTYKPEPFLNLLQQSAQHNGSQAQVNTSKKKKKKGKTPSPPPLDRVELCYVVPCELLENFKMPTDTKTFQSAVIDKVGADWEHVTSAVRLVGVQYTMNQSSPFAPGLAHQSQPAALLAQEYAYSNDTNAARAARPRSRTTKTNAARAARPRSRTTQKE